MKVVSYNVNGIRAAVKKGFLDWLKESNYDIVCLQETKAQDQQLPIEQLEELGYHVYHEQAEKKGYSGVAIFSKVKPVEVVNGIGKDIYDREGRVIRLVFKDFCVVNTYFPSGSAREERHDFKMDFLADYQIFIDKLRSENPPLIVVGDYNIVHTTKDIHNPTRKDNPSGYRPEERAWMDRWFEAGMTDAYRLLHPEEDDSFTWWSYRAGSRPRNKGWRIDYISIDNVLNDKVIDAQQMKDVIHSDHCPILAELKMD